MAAISYKTASRSKSARLFFDRSSKGVVTVYVEESDKPAGASIYFGSLEFDDIADLVVFLQSAMDKQA